MFTNVSYKDANNLNCTLDYKNKTGKLPSQFIKSTQEERVSCQAIIKVKALKIAKQIEKNKTNGPFAI